MKNARLAILILLTIAGCGDTTIIQCGALDGGADANFDAGPEAYCAAEGGTWIWYEPNAMFTCCHGPAANCAIIAGDAGMDAHGD
jgi:hypothetical protein